MKIRATASSIPRHRFPVDEWRLVETEPSSNDLGLTETLFAVGNGYLGMRDNPPEGRDAHTHGTFLNGFHETWPIHHAESAFAFAKTGQTIVNVPDAKTIKLYVDDEPLLLAEADLEHYERVVDFRSGRSHREVVWRTPASNRVRVRSERMVSLVQRHLAVLRFEVTLLDYDGPIVVSSQMLNRQDGEDEYHVTAAALGEGEGRDPRQGRRFDQRVLEPRLQDVDPDLGVGGEVTLGYRTVSSRMTMACAYRHMVTTNCPHDVETEVSADLAKTVFTVDGRVGETFAITKYVSYHSSRGVPPEELKDRCNSTIDRAVAAGPAALEDEQRHWLDEYWHHSDIVIDGDAAAQQAIRWNLFQLAQASARTHEQGIAAKGVTAGGYDGHYFWDTEVYVLPYLSYTNPEAARKLLRFRWRMLDAARNRAHELSQRGALYPWRTINGEEASAYYAAGTAQYHINAAIAYALERYLTATGDQDFLEHEAVEILAEMARMFADLGFYYSSNGEERFHIHGVTGPDEYTTVVNDNMYTNLMARFNLGLAAWAVDTVEESNPTAYEALVRATGLSNGEVAEWRQAADSMFIPFDDELRIHPQDVNFLRRERWDFAGTPSDKYPLLLHFHPLVIYRHQVLKQADVVLAMFLRSKHFDTEQKRRNFDYYDPLTTGDSSLSACVQSIVAADVGYSHLAYDYFNQSLYLDLADSHGNTTDGVHIANAGGVWAAIVYGFAGMTDREGCLAFTPRLPEQWNSIAFRLLWHGRTLKVTVDCDGCLVELESGDDTDVLVDGATVVVGRDKPLRIPAQGH